MAQSQPKTPGDCYLREQAAQALVRVGISVDTPAYREQHEGPCCAVGCHQQGAISTIPLHVTPGAQDIKGAESDLCGDPKAECPAIEERRLVRLPLPPPACWNPIHHAGTWQADQPKIARCIDDGEESNKNDAALKTSRNPPSIPPPRRRIPRTGRYAVFTTSILVSRLSQETPFLLSRLWLTRIIG